MWRQRKLILGNHWDTVHLIWSEWKDGRSVRWRFLAKCLSWCFCLLGYLMRRKPGSGETDTGGGRQQNFFEQQGSEKDEKHSDASGAMSLFSGLGTHPAVWKVIQDLPADMALERHKWFLCKFVWSWTELVWSQLLWAELKVKYYPAISCVPTWIPIMLRQCAGWDCTQVILLHREGFFFCELPPAHCAGGWEQTWCLVVASSNYPNETDVAEGTGVTCRRH